MPKKLLPERTADFIESMECLPVAEVPEGPEWTYELKLDGYRLEAVRTQKEIILYSRRKNIPIKKFPYIAAPLKGLPEGTVVDGSSLRWAKMVGPTSTCCRTFALRRRTSPTTPLTFWCIRTEILPRSLCRNVEILRTVIEPAKHIALSEVSNQTATEMLKFVRSHGLEGIIAKRSDSVYQAGLRTGVWSKHRINLGQEFVIGGYTPGTHGFDSLVIGFYQGKDLHYAARVRAGFVPATRRTVFEQIKGLEASKCPFTNRSVRNAPPA